MWSRVRVRRTSLKGRRAHYVKHKKFARAVVEERLRHYASRYGFLYNRLAIRNTRSRWGSCSKKGNLNFNYKVALLPEQLRDYVVVHELCHLKEFNHSKNFWALVAQTFPNYQTLRRDLQKSSLLY